MQNVTVNKKELLEKVKTNRAAHREIFLESQKNYRKAVIEQLDSMLEDAKNNKRIRTSISLTAPTDQTKEYDTVIDMLEMSTAVEISLTAREFSNYVRDDWAWKEQFLYSNSHYNVKASAMYEAVQTGDYE